MIDSLSVSLGQGLMVLTAARLAEDGTSLDQVAETVAVGGAPTAITSIGPARFRASAILMRACW